MERKNGALFYYCAIPKKVVIPEGFIIKEVSEKNTNYFFNMSIIYSFI